MSVLIQGPNGKVRVDVNTLVCYKDNIETYGKVIKIQGSILTIKNGFNDKIVLRNTRDCWDE